MTLDNLQKTGQLKPHASNAAEIARLLEAARRNLTDASAQNISTENRFDAAYKCIMQSALAALMANGYRPDTKVPGHHQTVIQSLPKTIGLPGTRVAVLDALRNKRNLSDYSGRDIDRASLTTCMAEASRLLAEVQVWLAKAHPDLKG
ncbi:MAG: DNA-binding protein [Rhodocyclales bacterium]|nr:DNA-binding protein [Rhodocyclales bacterium]